MLQAEKDYRERLTGKTWAEIAGGRTSKGVMKAARRWALNHKVPWPPAPFEEPAPSPQTRKVLARGKEVYEERMRQTSKSWKDFTRADITRAKQYAESEGLPWPPPRRTRSQVSYELRVEGLSWKQVAALAGYKYEQHACWAAKKWADKADLPWPINVD